MKFLFDLFPVILFFIAFKIPDDPHEGVLLATGVAIIASIAQVAILWFTKKRVEKMHIVTLVLILVLGSLTLIFQDERFIKWKPTLVNWAFAIAFLGSHFIGEHPIIRRMMQENVKLPDAIWFRLSLGWISFFIFAGAANLYVAFNFDIDTWVNFKLFGMMGLTILFVIAQGFYLMRHVEEPITDEPLKNNED